MEKWHVVLTKTAKGEQKKAEGNLQNQQFEVLNPKMTVKSLKSGKVAIKVEPVFPGYVFVKFDPLERSASVINNSRGVRRLLTFGNNLIPVSTDVIEALQERFKKEDELKEVVPNQGEKVEIKAGPLRGLKAIFDEPCGATRSFLMIEMIGTTKRIGIDNLQFI